MVILFVVLLLPSRFVVQRLLELNKIQTREHIIWYGLEVPDFLLDLIVLSTGAN